MVKEKVLSKEDSKKSKSIGKLVNSDKIFQFKITLDESRPKIWRRIMVPADYSFFALHCAIQNAMGWTDSHLHAFYIQPANRPTSDMITIELPNPEGDDLFFPRNTRDERKEKIADYFGKIVKQCGYCYDFGDNWDHTVLFERELERDYKATYPKCVAGENACPPEDCGSIWGYSDLQKIIKDPKHKEHKDMLKWLGINDPSEFNPNEFNLTDIDFEDPKKRLKEWNDGFRV